MSPSSFWLTAAPVIVAVILILVLLFIVALIALTVFDLRAPADRPTRPSSARRGHTSLSPASLTSLAGRRDDHIERLALDHARPNGHVFNKVPRDPRETVA